MVLAPLFLLAAQIVSPKLDSDEAGQLSIVADHVDRWYLAAVLGLVSIVLAVPAVLGLMHMLRERRAAYGHVGGGLALLGLLAAMGGTAISMVVWQMVAGGADRAEMVALLDRVNNTAGTVVPFYIGTFLFGLGMAVIALGLYLARAVYAPYCLALAAGAIVLVIGFPVASVAMTIVGAALLVVGFGSIGRIVLTEPDEAWEHTPEIGFRPAVGTR
jgi:hypothetical protein